MKLVSTRSFLLSFFAVLSFSAVSLNSFAEDEAPAGEASAEDAAASAKAFDDSLKYQTGKIELPGGIATLSLSEKFRYLSPQDAERVLTEGWGNPPGELGLGMIVPADKSPIDPAGWGVEITYEEDGHVSDKDADEINYDDLLKDMQEGTKEANEERVKQGYSSLNLVGWAEKPSYDKANHKLYWAQELATGDNPEHTLNYSIRVLGRKGVLVLNAIAGMSQISSVKQEMQDVVAFANFNQGNTYGDFDSRTDKTAEYGLAALVAGGVAAKMGFFGKLFAILLAAKKLIAVAVIGLIAGIKKFFGGAKEEK